jgi:hypothetical protein
MEGTGKTPQFWWVLYQLDQFIRHRSQPSKMSENFRESQVTEVPSESVADTVTEGPKVHFFSVLSRYLFLEGMAIIL